MSDRAWAFISGGLFYIIFAIYILYEIFTNKIKKNKMKKEEILPLVNQKGEIIGQAPRSDCHKTKNLMHPVIHLHIFNSKNAIFLQKRAKHKLVQPEKWDTAVGGHVSLGETIEQALLKESKEELGLGDINAKFYKTYVWKSTIETELVYIFIGYYNGKIKIDNNEVDDGKFWNKKEIDLSLKKNIFTENFEYEYNTYISKMFNDKII